MQLLRKGFSHSSNPGEWFTPSERWSRYRLHQGRHHAGMLSGHAHVVSNAQPYSGRTCLNVHGERDLERCIANPVWNPIRTLHGRGYAVDMRHSSSAVRYRRRRRDGDHHNGPVVLFVATECMPVVPFRILYIAGVSDF